MIRVRADFVGHEVTMTFVDKAPDRKVATLAYSDTGKRFEVYAAKLCSCSHLKTATLAYRVALLAQDLGVPQLDIVNHTKRPTRNRKIDPSQRKLI